jgi:hypothetical protein
MSSALGILSTAEDDALKDSTMASPRLPLFEIAFLFMRLDHIASIIINANHGIV